MNQPIDYDNKIGCSNCKYYKEAFKQYLYTDLCDHPSNLYKSKEYTGNYKVIHKQEPKDLNMYLSCNNFEEKTSIIKNIKLMIKGLIK